MTLFPNLAGNPNADDFIEQELSLAGIPSTGKGHWYYKHALKRKGEVKSGILAGFTHWEFERAWRYWIVTGPGLPLEQAEALHKEYGSTARVSGSCLAPSPVEGYGGFPVPLYHVDSQEALNALAESIRAIFTAHNAEWCPKDLAVHDPRPTDR